MTENPLRPTGEQAVADEEPAAPRRRRRARGQETDPDPADATEGRAADPETTENGAADASAGPEKGDQERAPSRRGRPGLPAGAAARRAGAEVAALTHRRPEAVTCIERVDGHWRIGVEVLETKRIPDSADILAIYEVELEPDGELSSYRRVKRYERGRMSGEGQ
jgi:Gas vesicle synthesis protein GvpO